MGEFSDEGSGVVDLGWIEPVGWFIEDEHLWIVDQSGGEPDALSIAFGEMSDSSLGDLGDSGGRHGLIDGGSDFFAGDAIEFGSMFKIAFNAHFWVDRGAFGEVSNGCLCESWVGEHVMADDGDRAFVWREEPGHHSDGCAFARAIWSQ